MHELVEVALRVVTGARLGARLLLELLLELLRVLLRVPIGPRRVGAPIRSRAGARPGADWRQGRRIGFGGRRRAWEPLSKMQQRDCTVGTWVGATVGRGGGAWKPLPKMPVGIAKTATATAAVNTAMTLRAQDAFRFTSMTRTPHDQRNQEE